MKTIFLGIFALLVFGQFANAQSSNRFEAERHLAQYIKLAGSRGDKSMEPDMLYQKMVSELGYKAEDMADVARTLCFIEEHLPFSYYKWLSYLYPDYIQDIIYFKKACLANDSTAILQYAGNMVKASRDQAIETIEKLKKVNAMLENRRKLAKEGITKANVLTVDVETLKEAGIWIENGKAQYQFLGDKVDGDKTFNHMDITFQIASNERTSRDWKAIEKMAKEELEKIWTEGTSKNLREMIYAAKK